MKLIKTVKLELKVVDLVEIENLFILLPFFLKSFSLFFLDKELNFFII